LLVFIFLNEEIFDELVVVRKRPSKLSASTFYWRMKMIRYLSNPVCDSVGTSAKIRS
jgi:hypothetical protein